VARYAIDAKTLVQIVAEGLPVHAGHQLVSAGWVRSEALSLLFEDVARGRLPEGEALRLHERLTEVKLRLLGDRVSRRAAWIMARDHGWGRTHEAEYIAVAELQADALVTIDPKLAEMAVGLVPLAPMEALSRPPEPGDVTGDRAGSAGPWS
jgi:predicted nucleic acid-binding protein